MLSKCREKSSLFFSIHALRRIACLLWCIDGCSVGWFQYVHQCSCRSIPWSLLSLFFFFSVTPAIFLINAFQWYLFFSYLFLSRSVFLISMSWLVLPMCCRLSSLSSALFYVYLIFCLWDQLFCGICLTYFEYLFLHRTICWHKSS